MSPSAPQHGSSSGSASGAAPAAPAAPASSSDSSTVDASLFSSAKIQVRSSSVSREPSSVAVGSLVTFPNKELFR